jgi:tRNA uridine 5-carboxymethylaminomethyl modification enzyme
MSCNPAIGGIGKSHLAREIDAMGGLMARATDLSGIHFRVLNSSKGQAVRATRAQTDRALYKKAIQGFLKNYKNLSVLEDEVEDLLITKGRAGGILTKRKNKIKAECVILTAGTFLGGVMHTGLKQEDGGRAGAEASNNLAKRLRSLPLEVGRMKTGTPPRIDGSSINWNKTTAQSGDTPRPVMSFAGKTEDHPKQVNCYITRTNENTHRIIKGALAESPLYTGVIKGIGPRYCPSIEDKVVRYSGKDSHQIFLEPEGLDTDLVYPNGISTSLPLEEQIKMVQSIQGLEASKIVQPGYAIEYDYFNPRGLYHTLESKHIHNLFLAGQINGTTGYEEAGAQGLLAGINASLKVRKKVSWVPRRDQAYMGVMVDDLVIQGTMEPYRMFTSRAEHRLLLREDNADLRLSGIANDMGILHKAAWKRTQEKKRTTSQELSSLKEKFIIPESIKSKKLEKETGERIAEKKSFFDALKRPAIKYLNLVENPKISQNYIDEIEAEIKYAGYIVRQHKEVKRAQKKTQTKLSRELNYKEVRGLSIEVAEKLEKHKPEDLGEASRISGVTPAAISLLLVYLKKKTKKQGSAAA